jgi:dynein heavy chain
LPAQVNAHSKSRKDWELSQETAILDMVSMIWSLPDPVSKRLPLAREDAAWCYDRLSASLVMFGGWANRWLNDTWVLDVSGVVGPPYACLGCKPAMGPVTGGTAVVLSGLSFSEPQSDLGVRVRFTTQFASETVKGEWLGDSVIGCQTPSFEKFGAGEALIAVDIDGLGFTVHRVKFAYYVNTKPQKCLAFGPGVATDGVVWGLPTQFIIQAKDGNGRNRTSGGDPFIVRISTQVLLPGAKELEEVLVPTKITDTNDGTYTVEYTLLSAGEYTLAIQVEGEDHIRGSPLRIKTANPWQHPKINGHAPVCNEHSRAVVVGKRMLFWGGPSDEVHILDTDMWRWSSPLINAPNGLPDQRCGHTMCSVSDKTVVVTCGQTVKPADWGISRKGSVDPDTAAKFLEQRSELDVPDFVPKVLCDVWVLTVDRDSVTWAKPEISGQPPQSGRYNLAVAYLPGAGVKKVVLHGGKDGAHELQDTMCAAAAAAAPFCRCHSHTPETCIRCGSSSFSLHSFTPFLTCI